MFFSSKLLWTSSLLDVPAGVTQEEGHTGFLNHLPSAVRALIFLARRIQPFLSLVDRAVEFCVLTIESFSTCWACFKEKTRARLDLLSIPQSRRLCFILFHFLFWSCSSLIKRTQRLSTVCCLSYHKSRPGVMPPSTVRCLSITNFSPWQSRSGRVDSPA